MEEGAASAASSVDDDTADAAVGGFTLVEATAEDVEAHCIDLDCGGGGETSSQSHRTTNLPPIPGDANDNDNDKQGEEDRNRTDADDDGTDRS